MLNNVFMMLRMNLHGIVLQTNLMVGTFKTHAECLLKQINGENESLKKQMGHKQMLNFCHFLEAINVDSAGFLFYYFY
jgi:hypothetical protein